MSDVANSIPVADVSRACRRTAAAERPEHGREYSDDDNHHERCDRIDQEGGKQQGEQTETRSDPLHDAGDQGRALLGERRQEFLEPTRTVAMLRCPGGIEEGVAQLGSEVCGHRGAEPSGLPSCGHGKRDAKHDEQQGKPDGSADRRHTSSNQANFVGSVGDRECRSSDHDEKEGLEHPADERRDRQADHRSTMRAQ